MPAREVVRQRARERTRIVVAPVVVQIDRLDAHLEHLAGLGALDRHRPGAHVARQLLAHVRLHGRQRGGHDQRRRRHHLARARHGRDGDGVAAVDGEERLAAWRRNIPSARSRRRHRGDGSWAWAGFLRASLMPGASLSRIAARCQQIARAHPLALGGAGAIHIDAARRPWCIRDISDAQGRSPAMITRTAEGIPPGVPLAHHGLVRRLSARRHHLRHGGGGLHHLPAAHPRRDAAGVADDPGHVPVHQRVRVGRAPLRHAPARAVQGAARHLRAPHAQPPPVLHRRGDALPRPQGLARHRVPALRAGRVHPDVDAGRHHPRAT